MRALICAALLVLPAGAACAEEPPSGAAPMILKVRPSAVDDPAAAARAREERLERRMAEAEYLFRNICVRCGGIDRPGAYAPFNPTDALGHRR